MANIYTNQWGARVVACESHSAKMLRYILGDIRQDGTTDAECPECRTERVRAEQPGVMRAALESPALSHTRARNWCGVTIVYAYHADHTSPSGVRLAAGIEEPAYNQIVAAMKAEGAASGRMSPLSPTEGLCAPSQGRW